MRNHFNLQRKGSTFNLERQGWTEPLSKSYLRTTSFGGETDGGHAQRAKQSWQSRVTPQKAKATLLPTALPRWWLLPSVGLIPPPRSSVSATEGKGSGPQPCITCHNSLLRAGGSSVLCFFPPSVYAGLAQVQRKCTGLGVKSIYFGSKPHYMYNLGK